MFLSRGINARIGARGFVLSRGVAAIIVTLTGLTDGEAREGETIGLDLSGLGLAGGESMARQPGPWAARTCRVKRDLVMPQAGHWSHSPQFAQPPQPR